MGAQHSKSRRVVLDVDRLSAGEPVASAEIWRRRLASGGALAVGDVPKEHPLWPVQRALAELEQDRGISRGLKGVLIAGVPIALVSLLLILVLSVIGMIIAAALGTGLFAWYLKQERSSAPTPDQVQASVALNKELDRLLARSFVVEHAGVVVEHSADLYFLKTRIRDGERARRALRDKTGDVVDLIRELRTSNKRLGVERDSDIDALELEKVEIADHYERLSELVSELRQQKEELELRFEARRALARRAQLGREVDQLTESNDSARLAADLEVDMLELESRLEALDVAVADDDARLRATLEMRALSM